MDVSKGHGGWFRFSVPGEPLTYVRFAPNEIGRWVVVELYTTVTPTSEDQLDLTFHPRAITTLETFANRPDTREALERDTSPGPDLRRLASHFAATWTKPTHWVAASYLAQFPRSGVRQAPMGPEPDVVARPRRVPACVTPKEGLTDAFLRQVAEAYDIAVSLGRHPAPAIADVSMVEPSTVRKWVYIARKRGIMSRGQQGRVG